MAIAVRRADKALQQRLDQAMPRAARGDARHPQSTSACRWSKCSNCIISGDLPSHGPYKPAEAGAPGAGDAAGGIVASSNDWLAHGADVNVELNNAVMADDQKRVAYLLEKKHASGRAQDLQGETPLHHAIIHGLALMVEFLIAHGAGGQRARSRRLDPAHDGGLSGQCRRRQACSPSTAPTRTRSVRRISPRSASPRSTARTTPRVALIDAGRRPGHSDRRGRLHAAHARDREPRASRWSQALLKKGADINARNSGGVTALMIAAANGRADMVELLMRAGRERSGADASAATRRCPSRAPRGNEKDHQTPG